MRGSVPFFLAVTAWWLWPWPLHLGTHVAAAPYWWDAPLNAYLLAEAGRNLAAGGPLFDARILHPTPDVLALSENLFVFGAASHLLGRLPPLGAHNALLMLGLAGSGVASFAYLRRRTDSPWAALAGAVLFTYAPFRLGQLSRIQLVVTPWLPLVLLALERAVERPRLRRLLLVGGLGLVQFMTGVYYALHLALLAAPTLLAFALRNRWKVRTIVKIGLAAAIVATAAVPVAGPYLRAASNLGLERDAGFVAGTSGRLRDLGTASRLQRVWGFAGWHVSEGSAREPTSFPGLLLLGLAAAGVVAWRRAQTVETTVDFGAPGRVAFGPGVHLAWAAGAFVLFLGTGPDSVLGEWAPFGWLRVVPAFRGLRYASRFGVLLTFALAALAAYGVDDLLRRLRPTRPRLARVLGPALVLVALAELSTRPLPLRRVPGPEPVLAQLRDEAATGALAELPFDRDDHAARTGRDLAVLTHGKRTLSGYTGFDPPAWRLAREELASVPEPRSLAFLAAVGVDRLLVHEHEQLPDERIRLRAALAEAGLARLGGDAGHAIYAVGGAGAEAVAGRCRAFEPPTPPGERLVPPTAMRVAPELADGDPQTRWTTGRPQRPGDAWFEIGLDRPRRIVAIWLDLRHFPLDFPRGLKLEGRVAGAWTTLLEAPLHLPVEAIASAPTRLVDAFRFAPAQVDAVRLSGLGAGRRWASVGEVALEEAR